jgi:hypothetical protein
MTMATGGVWDVAGSPDKHTPGPWHYEPSTVHHGPYVIAEFGGDVCDCYTMSNLAGASVRNGGDSKPIHFHGERADANARLIAAAPDLLEAAKAALNFIANTEGELGITLNSGDLLRAALSAASGRAPTNKEE